MLTDGKADKPARGRGRPRAFDENAALERAIDLFWLRGYAATSLDDLTQAMGLSRSSFYACFGSKRAVLVRALGHYAAASLAILRNISDSHDDPGAALKAMATAIAKPGDGPRGCLMANCITELAPDDPEIAAMARHHIAQVEALFAERIEAGDRAAVKRKASTLTALAMGAITMRKAGIADRRIDSILDLAGSLPRSAS